MTLSTQFLTMLTMIGMGTFFGAALDTYNRFLKRGSRKLWIVFINDILFWVLQGLLIFYILFRVNNGEWRVYIFLALLCGFSAYKSLFQRLYKKILEGVISLIISCYRLIVKIIQLLVFKPVQAFFMVLISAIIMLGKGIYHLIRWIMRVFFTIIKLAFKPFYWILLLIWKLSPKPLKKSIKKIYNKLAGKFNIIKNIINKLCSFWKKRKK